MIVADGLSVRGVYADVSLTAETGALVAVAGPTGSGRTSVLLTLAGRMKPTSGTLAVGGHTRPGAIRRVAALALVDGVTDFDRALTVREHLHERRRKPYQEVLKRTGLTVDDRTRVADLDREQQVRLGIALALLDHPQVIVADNVDAGLPVERQAAVWGLLRNLDTTVVASCVHPVGPADVIVELAA